MLGYMHAHASLHAAAEIAINIQKSGSTCCVLIIIESVDSISRDGPDVKYT